MREKIEKTAATLDQAGDTRSFTKRLPKRESLRGMENRRWPEKDEGEIEEYIRQLLRGKRAQHPLPSILRALNARSQRSRLAGLKALVEAYPSISGSETYSALEQSLLHEMQRNKAVFRVDAILSFCKNATELHADLHAFMKKVMPRHDVNQQAPRHGNEGSSEQTEDAKSRDSIEVRRETRRTEVKNALTRGYLIRIPKREDRVRALGVLGGVPFAYHSCGLEEYVVMGVHINALLQANVSFEDITKRP